MNALQIFMDNVKDIHPRIKAKDKGPTTLVMAKAKPQINIPYVYY